MEQAASDPLHNDDIPCCRTLEEIAQTILSNWSNKNSNDNVVDNTVVSAATDTSFLSSFSQSKGLSELMQDFLWEQHRRNVQLEQEQTVIKKKRKKKKKKKVKSDGTGCSGETVTVNGETQTEAMEWSPSIDSESLIVDSSIPEQNFRGNDIKQTEEPHKNSSENQRDWWISCYLNRCIDPVVSNRVASGKGILIHEFLKFLAPKIPLHRGNTDLSVGVGNGNHIGSNVAPKQKQAPRRLTRQQPTSRQQKDPKDSFVHVSQNDLDKIVGNIDCYPCQKRVKTFLTSSNVIALFNLNEMMARTGDSCQSRVDGLAGSNDGGEERHPFDYVAMEEGNAGHWDTIDASGQGERLVLQAVKSPDGNICGWQLQKQKDGQITADADGRPELDQNQVANVTEKDFSFLIREFFLLSAFSYDKLVGACDMDVLSSEKVNSITETVDNRYSTILTELTECMKELLKQQEILASFESNDGDRVDPQANDGIDVKRPVMLNDSESAISGVLGKLLRIVLQVTHAYQEIMLQWNGTSADDLKQQRGTHCASRLQSPSLLLGQVSATESIWRPYLDAFSQILDATAEFERDLFQLADRQGGLKLFFLCPRSRQLQAKLVQAKLKIVVFAVEAIRKQLDEKCDSYDTPFKIYRPTFLRSILTQQVLLQVIRTSTAHGKQFADLTPASTSELSTLNDACEDVVHEIRQSWTETIRQQNMSQFQEAYAIKVEKLGRLLRTAHTLLDHQQQEQRAVGNWRIDDSEDAGVANFLQRVSEYSQMSGDVLSVFRSQIVPAVNSMIHRWLILSIATPTLRKTLSSPDHAPTNGGSMPLIMPLRLIRWMSSEGPCNLRAQYLRCPGADGSLRATCLIMVLLFGWFVKQYNEWQAVLAEQELLMIMSKNDTVASSESAIGPATTHADTGKKKAKKKKGKAPTNASAENKWKLKESLTTGAAPSAETPEQSGKQTSVQQDGDEDDSDQSTAATEPLSASKVVTSIVSESNNKKSSLSEAGVASETDTKRQALGASSVDAMPPVDSGEPLGVQGEILNKEQQPSSTLPTSDEMISGARPAPTESAATKVTIPNDEGEENKRGTFATKLESRPCPFIGVTDGSTAIPAQEYLLGRLLNMVKCAEDNGHLIVNL